VDSLPADRLPPADATPPPAAAVPGSASTAPPVDGEPIGAPAPDEVNVPGVVPTDPAAAALCR